MQELGPNQRKWLKTLQSNVYVQGKQYLRRGDSFCCLGVACEVFALNGIPDSDGETEEEKEAFPILYWYNQENEIAPQDIVEILKLQDQHGSPINNSTKISLTSLNDTGKTFQEIAQIIEQDPSVYFLEPA